MPQKVSKRKQQIKERLIQLNNLYGRGDVLDVTFDTPVEGYVTRKPYSMQAEKRRFTVNGPTVYYVGHQSDFTKPIRL